MRNSKYNKIRTEIKKLSELQKVLKPQRKESYKGPITPGTVSENKYELRHLFQVYAILKGIDRPEIKKPSNYNGILLDEKKVQTMVEEFRPVMVEVV